MSKIEEEQAIYRVNRQKKNRDNEYFGKENRGERRTGNDIY